VICARTTYTSSCAKHGFRTLRPIRADWSWGMLAIIWCY